MAKMSIAESKIHAREEMRFLWMNLERAVYDTDKPMNKIHARMIEKKTVATRSQNNVFKEMIMKNLNNIEHKFVELYSEDKLFEFNRSIISFEVKENKPKSTIENCLDTCHKEFCREPHIYKVTESEEDPGKMLYDGEWYMTVVMSMVDLDGENYEIASYDSREYKYGMNFHITFPTYLYGYQNDVELSRSTSAITGGVEGEFPPDDHPSWKITTVGTRREEWGWLVDHINDSEFLYRMLPFSKKTFDEEKEEDSRLEEKKIQQEFELESEKSRRHIYDQQTFERERSRDKELNLQALWFFRSMWVAHAVSWAYPLFQPPVTINIFWVLWAVIGNFIFTMVYLRFFIKQRSNNDHKQNRTST